MNAQRKTLTLLQASQNSPNLAKLMTIHKESMARLQAIEPLIPASLRKSVQSGPLDEGAWCLLVANNTTAAKMRQLLPTFEAHLRVNGLDVKSIRLKVHRQEIS